MTAPDKADEQAREGDRVEPDDYWGFLGRQANPHVGTMTERLTDEELDLTASNDEDWMDRIHSDQIAAMARELLAYRRAGVPNPADIDLIRQHATDGGDFSADELDFGVDLLNHAVASTLNALVTPPPASRDAPPYRWKDVCREANGPDVCEEPCARCSKPPASRADADLRAENEFNRGYVIACCNMTNLHGSPEIAFDTLLVLGITNSQVKDMDLSEYDAKAMKDIESAGGNQSLFMDGRSKAAKRQARGGLSASRPGAKGGT